MLSPDQRRRFDEDGFVVVEDLLDQKSVLGPLVAEYEALRAGWVADGLLDPNAPSGSFQEQVCSVYAAGLDYSQPLDISLPPGQIRADTPFHAGPAANLFVAGFIGSPRMSFLGGRIDGVDGARTRITIEGGHSLATDVPNTPAAGTAVTLVIRPEHLKPVDPGAGVLEGEVQIAEQLGGETFVYVVLATGGSVTVEIKGQAPVRPGDPMALAFEDSKYHLFGPDENVIRHG